jgi:hypothetical protein
VAWVDCVGGRVSPRIHRYICGPPPVWLRPPGWVPAVDLAADAGAAAKQRRLGAPLAWKTRLSFERAVRCMVRAGGCRGRPGIDGCFPRWLVATIRAQLSRNIWPRERPETGEEGVRWRHSRGRPAEVALQDLLPTECGRTPKGGCSCAFS